MDKVLKDAILQQGLDRIETYRKVIESIQSGVSEAESCRLYNINLRKFRRWCRDNYTQENEVDESFMIYDDFFSWQDALMYAVTENKNIVATSDFDEAWTYIKTTLREREVKVLEMRFEESMTLEEIASIFNITRESVRRIENNAIQHLRHQSRAKILLYGIKYIEAFESFKKANEEKRQAEFNANVLDGKFNPERGTTIQDSKKRGDFINFSLEDLNLSSRSYNCFERAGINDIQDILDFSDSKGLSKLRNFGLKSFDEVQKKLREFGCFKDLIYSKE